MHSTDYSGDAALHHHPLAPGDLPTPTQPLHRLAEVRAREGVSLRAVARHLGTNVPHVKFQELPTTDLPISELYRWRDALGVPLAELLAEPEENLSTQLMNRAHLVRLMKTAMALVEQTKQISVRRMAQTLVEQLIEIMPELRDVTAWHLVGRRRRRDEFGRTAENTLSEDMFTSRPE